jgi:CBS domain-containing protein
MNESERPVSEIMRTQFVTLKTEDRLDLADDVMKLGRIRHMPVLEGKRLVGIVSQRDLLAASLSRALDFEASHRRSFLKSVAVNEVMAQAVVNVGVDTTIREAALLMVRRKIGCLPVVTAEGAPVGLVTETDLLRSAYGVGTASDEPS